MVSERSKVHRVELHNRGSKGGSEYFTLMVERRRRKGFKLSEMIEGLGTSLSDTLQDNVEQEIKEADHSRNHEQEQGRDG